MYLAFLLAYALMNLVSALLEWMAIFWVLDMLIVSISSEHFVSDRSAKRNEASCLEINRLVAALFMICLHTRLRSMESSVTDSALIIRLLDVLISSIHVELPFVLYATT